MHNFFDVPPSEHVTTRHRELLDVVARAHHAVYLGHDAGGWRFARPEHSVMILGPPRSGKTSSLIIPNVLAANGPVVSTSTKPDVLEATRGARSRLGRCHLFDPTGSVPRVDGLVPLRWSPLQSCGTWPGALSMARSLVEVGSAGRSPGAHPVDGSHWTERAQALLAPLLYAAALDGGDMRTVLTWVDRHQALPAQQILAGAIGQRTELARNLLDGITITEGRELSSIWSTASGALSGFRSDHALDTTTDPTFDPVRFVESGDTIYIAAAAHEQAAVAPLVVGLLEDVRQAAYAGHASAVARPSGSPRPPLLLALDEVANIAPIPELPSMVSEGGGQGVITLACFQDLSQARQRWPGRADGFASLFGTTVVLPGIGDVTTLEALSTLAGDEELAVRTLSAGQSATDRPFNDLLTGGRPHHGESVSTQWRRRLPPDVITRGVPGHLLAFDERNQPGWVPLAPSYRAEPWRSLRELGREHGLGHEAGPSLVIER
jgi:type IV secretory pathway TraG/TraD family ATPase VirD4